MPQPGFILCTPERKVLLSSTSRPLHVFLTFLTKQLFCFRIVHVLHRFISNIMSDIPSRTTSGNKHQLSSPEEEELVDPKKRHTVEEKPEVLSADVASSSSAGAAEGMDKPDVESQEEQKKEKVPAQPPRRQPRPPADRVSFFPYRT